MNCICDNCGSTDTKVVDTRTRNHSKSDIQIRLKLPEIFNRNIPFRWRKRICIKCEKVFYTIELDIEHLKGIFQSTNEPRK